MSRGLLDRAEIVVFEELCQNKRVCRVIAEEELAKIYAFLEKDLISIKKSYKKFLNGMIKKRDKKRTGVIVSIKPLGSLISKVIERKKSLLEVKDLVRATILLDTEDQVKKLYNDIARKKVEVIRCIYKDRGDDEKFGYYGSYHIVFFYEGLNVELQIMTRKLWSYKDEAHKFYHKYREEENPNIDKEDLHISKMLFSKGNQPKHHYKKSEIRQNYKKLIPFFKK